MPFAKRKPGRNPLQRLSDQRRSLALAGLAAGAVLGGAVFRRRRRGGEAEFERPVPPPPAARPESVPPAAAVSPPGVGEPEAAEASTAVTPVASTASDAGPSTGTASTGAAASPSGTASSSDTTSPAEAEPSSSLDPATGELSAEEASILAVLAQSGRIDDDRTAIAVATSLERETADVAAVLRKLGNEGVVSGELYTAAGEKIWAVTERGVRRLGAQH